MFQVLSNHTRLTTTALDAIELQIVFITVESLGSADSSKWWYAWPRPWRSHSELSTDQVPSTTRLALAKQK